MPGFLTHLQSQHNLTEGEANVIDLLDQGQEVSAIATHLDVSVDVVRKRLSEIYKKLEIKGSRGPGGKLKYLKQYLDKQQTELQRQTLDLKSSLYGRDEDLKTLENWVDQDKCRLIMLYGMQGMGKTNLAASLFQRLQQSSSFKKYLWISPCPPLNDLLAQFLRNFEIVNAEKIQSNPTAEIARLVDYCRQYRCLVVIDELDAIHINQKTIGHFRQGYSLYRALIKAIAEETHQSCWILTASDVLPDIEQLASIKTGFNTDHSHPIQNLVRIWQLRTLPDDAALKLIREQVNIDNAKSAWLKLAQQYQGNPLAIKLATHFIKEYFGGNIHDFLSQDSFVFGDISLIIQAQTNRLSSDEEKILKALFSSSKGLTLMNLTQMSDARRADIMTAVQSLRRRSLIKRTERDKQIFFSLQPLIFEYYQQLFKS